MPIRHYKPLPPLSEFYLHMAYSILKALLVISIALFIGMLGYHVFEHMSWINAFSNASMILSGMGPFGPLTTNAGKLFAGFYALFSGLAFIMIMGVIFSPLIRRFLHKFHLELNDEK